MKRLLTMSLLFLTLGTFFLFAPASHKTAHANANGGCSQNNNVTYSDDSNNSNGQLDLWPCISYDSHSVNGYGYASFRNTASYLYQSDANDWYQITGCRVAIGLIPVGGNLDTAQNTPLAAPTANCFQWVKDQSIGIALPTSSFSVDSLSLFGNYQTAAQVTLTYADQSGNTLTEASPTEYSPVAKLNWSQTCTQANGVSFKGVTSDAIIDLWPCMGMNRSNVALDVSASFRNRPDTILEGRNYNFETCEVDISIDSAYPQAISCYDAAWHRDIGALLYDNQFNLASSNWYGYHTITAQVILTYFSSGSYKYLTSDKEARSAFYS